MFSVEICDLADVGGLYDGFQFRPDPSAMKAQELKTRVVPSGTLLASLDPTIEFADELADSPAWRASCRCLPPSMLRDTLSSKVCR